MNQVQRRRELHEKNYPICFDTAEEPIEKFIPSISENYLSQRFNQNISHKINQAVKDFILYQCSSERKHLGYPSGFYLSSGANKYTSDVRKYTSYHYGFKPNDLFSYLEDEKILNVHSIQSKTLGHTKAYSLTDGTINSVMDFFKNFKISENKKAKLNLNENGIYDENSEGNQRETYIQIPRWLNIKDVNESYLKMFDVTMNDFLESNDEMTEKDWLLYQMILGSLETQNGYLRQDYIESPFGRLYGKRGNESIQLIPNRILPLLIPNTNDYDLKASCFSLIPQIAQKYEQDIKRDFINDYVNDRKNIRNEVAKRLGVESDVIKKCFTALGHGARKSSHTWIENGMIEAGSITKILGSTELSKMFYQDKSVSGLCKEIYDCGKVITKNESYPSHLDLSSSQKLAYSYQHTEIEILQKIVEFFQIRNYQIISLKHDGMISKEEIDTNELHDFIQLSTGYDVGVEREALGTFFL